MDARELNNADMVETEVGNEEQQFRDYTVDEIQAFGEAPIPAKPLNFISLHDQIEDYLKEQLNEYIWELEKLERAEDLEQTILSVVVYDDRKKRGQEPTNKISGPISASFELPGFCFEYNVDIEAVLANKYPGRPQKYSIFLRLKDWKLEYRRRPGGIHKDHYYYHLPSNLNFRCKKEMIHYILYEVVLSKEREEEKRKKRKQDNNDVGASRN